MLASAVPLSLENCVEATTQEIAPAPSTREDGAFTTSSSDSNTLVDDSALSSATKSCCIDIAEDCQCDECLNYDVAIDMLEGGPSGEAPSHPENPLETLSPKPRLSRSEGVVNRLEHIASSFQASKSHISKDNAPKNVFTYQHNSIDELIEGTRPKPSLNGSAPPFVPKVDPNPSKAQRHTYRLNRADDLPNWVELGLAAEAADDSLFSRVWQLKALGALTLEEKNNFGSIISKLWKQMYLATQDSPNILKPTSLPNGSGSWNWSDFQLSAEDREISIFGVSKKLASLGFWSTYDEKALHNITLKVAKKWFVASSEEDAPSLVVAEHVFPKEGPERGATTLSEQTFCFANTECNTTGPLPGLYRDGRIITLEADLSNYASSDSEIAERSLDRGTDAQTDEVVIFKPHGRR